MPSPNPSLRARRAPLRHLLLGSLGLIALLGPSRASATPELAASAQDDAPVSLEETLAREGIRLDVKLGLASIPANVLEVDDLLEYLLVGPRGAGHESLFLTGVTPSLLNAALLSLGVETGLNARWEELSREEGDATEQGGEDAPPQYRLLLPEGDGFLLYVAWREDDETYLYRVDDVVSNLDTGRAMKRHRWVFLGSRFKSPREGEPEVFVADLEQNLICVSFFYQGNTLMTAALADCERQTIWVGNSWILPPRGEPVSLVFARRPIVALPDAWVDALPVVSTAPREQAPEEDSDG